MVPINDPESSEWQVENKIYIIYKPYKYRNRQRGLPQPPPPGVSMTNLSPTSIDPLRFEPIV